MPNAWRTLWKGALSFGLVTIPIRLYTAVDEKTISFNQLRASDHSRIAYKRVSKADGDEVGYDQIVKGYEYEPDRYAVFTPDELDALKPPSSRTIDIVQFVPLAQIDPIYFQRAYYLAPEPSGAKAYGLLAGAMRDRDTVAVCKVALRDKEHLATLRLRGQAAGSATPPGGGDPNVFVLETMYWPDEIRSFSLADVDVPELPAPRPQEVAMAETLIDNLTEDFDPTQFRDTYREAVLAAVAAKVEGEEITVVEPEGEPAGVVDLMEALQRSVAASKTKKAEAS